MAEPTTADASDAPQVPQPKSKKLLVIIVVAVLTSILGGGGAYWFSTKDDGDTAANEESGKDKSKSNAKAKAEPKAPAIYVEFEPAFVVNFEARGMTRFLQVAVQVLTRDPVTAEMIKQHDPVIRNDLLMLFGNQAYETISSREGKDKLRADALQAIAKIVEAEGGSGKSVEQLYFTSFVMQ
jgi:flagellar protein FliL